MKVKICTLNSKYIHSSLAPWYLLSAVRQRCSKDISASVVEGTVNEDERVLFDRIMSDGADAVAFGVYIWNVECIFRITAKIRKHFPNTVIIYGGPEVSYRQSDILEKGLCDYLISGEGEIPISSLLNALNDGRDADGIDGVSYVSDSGSHISEPYVGKGTPPSPYSEDYFAALHGRIAYIETSRGCPYSCAYCLSGRCDGMRFFDIDRVLGEITRLASSGTRTVKFIDRTFNADRARAAVIIRHILSERQDGRIPHGVEFHFEIEPCLLDEQLFELLATAPAGLFRVEVGIQSFNSDTLAAINRRSDLELTEKNIRRLIAPGNLHVHADLIAGLPYEDMSSFAKGFNRAYALRPDALQLGFLKLLYGSPMRSDPEKYPCVFSEKAPYEVVSTPWISASELETLKYTERAFDLLYNSGRFRRSLDFLDRVSGLDPFTTFRDFGEYIKCRDVSGLDALTDRYMEFFSGLSGDPAAFRDTALLDRILKNSSDVIPKGLRIDDPLRKKSKQYAKKYNKIKNDCRFTVEKLCVANKYIVVNYSDDDLLPQGNGAADIYGSEDNGSSDTLNKRLSYCKAMYCGTGYYTGYKNEYKYEIFSLED